MDESLRALESWLDHDFWNQGAFLTSIDSERVLLGKGGTFTRVESFIETDETIFYLKDFYQNSYLAYKPASTFEAGLHTILPYLKTLTDKHTPYTPSSNEDETYERDFSLLKSSFGETLQKVVMVSREYYDSFEGIDTIKRLFKKSFEFGVGQPYGIWNAQYGVIGSTPELLYLAQNQKLTTYALAGTMKVGLEEELLKSPKDRHEHDLVIKDITEKLAPFVSDLHVYETGIHPYKTIVHLKTDIEAKVEDINFTNLTNTLSPTAALGGYPKKESLQFLKNTTYSRKYPERFFGSCFGVSNSLKKEFVVSIRNVQWEGSSLYIESGGGVVTASEFKKEIDEIHLKRNTIRKHYL